METLVPSGGASAFSRMAGTSLRGQQLAASQSGFLYVQKHHCSTQSNAPLAAWRGDSVSVQPPVPCIVKLQLTGHRQGETTVLQTVPPGKKKGRKHRVGWRTLMLQETLDMSNFLATDRSNSHTGVISNIVSLPPLHIIGVVKALLQGQPPVDCSVCDETWSHCLQMPLMVSNLRTQRIIFLGCPAYSAGSCLGEAALQAAWNVFLRK